MSIPALRKATRSRWTDWKPKTGSLADSPDATPSKPSELGFVGFVGAPPEECARIDAEPSATKTKRASSLLNQAGVRLIRLEGELTIGIWSDMDSPELRAALRILSLDRLPVRFLDGADIPRPGTK